MTYPFSPHDWLKADSVTCHLDGSAPEEQEDQAIWGQGLSSHSQREQAKPDPGLPHGQPHSRPAPRPAPQPAFQQACPRSAFSRSAPQACRPGEYTRPWGKEAPTKAQHTKLVYKNVAQIAHLSTQEHCAGQRSPLRPWQQGQQPGSAVTL